MRTLVFDTETTGMVNFKSNDLTVQPEPVQIAAILLHRGKEYAALKLLINTNTPIHPRAKEAHGIEEEELKLYGVGMGIACGVFMAMLRQADRIVAHNINFDIIIMKAALAKSWADSQELIEELRSKSRVCTMHSTTPLLKLPGRYGFKWPKLEEAYKALVDPNGFEGAHDAMADVRACAAVLNVLDESKAPLHDGHGWK